MKKRVPEPVAEQIDARARELILEFMEHVHSVQAEYPGDRDRRKIFEGWAIQKIAALQFSVLQLTAELVELREQVRTK